MGVTVPMDLGLLPWRPLPVPAPHPEPAASAREQAWLCGRQLLPEPVAGGGGRMQPPAPAWGQLGMCCGVRSPGAPCAAGDRGSCRPQPPSSPPACKQLLDKAEAQAGEVPSCPPHPRAAGFGGVCSGGDHLHPLCCLLPQAPLPRAPRAGHRALSSTGPSCHAPGSCSALMMCAGEGCLVSPRPSHVTKQDWHWGWPEGTGWVADVELCRDVRVGQRWLLLSLVGRRGSVVALHSWEN